VFEVSLGTGGRFVDRGSKGTRGESPFTADIEPGPLIGDPLEEGLPKAPDTYGVGFAPVT
jgi:hypothetical protein